MQDLHLREAQLREAEETFHPQMSDLSEKKKELKADIDGLNEIMVEIENEANDLERRFEILQEKEDEFEQMKDSWERDFQSKEALLEDVQETLDKKEKDLEQMANDLSKKEKAFLEKAGEEQTRLESEERSLSHRIKVLEQSQSDVSKTRSELEQKSEQISNSLQEIENREKALAEKYASLEDDQRLFEEKKMDVENLRRKSIHSLNSVEAMKFELERDRKLLETREKRILQMERDAEELQANLTNQNLELSKLLESSRQRELAAAMKESQAEMKMKEADSKQKNSQELILRWEDEVKQAKERESKALAVVENLKQEEVILKESRIALKEYESELQKREWKLHDSWNVIKQEASKLVAPVGHEPPCALYSLLGSELVGQDAAGTGKNHDVYQDNVVVHSVGGRASESSSALNRYKLWAEATKRETSLQRWAISLAAESKRLKLSAEKIANSWAEFESQKCEARENKDKAEQLMKELHEKEEEVNGAIASLEVSQRKLSHEKKRIDDMMQELQKEREELEASKQDLNARTKSLKSLESSWKERMSELRDREKSVSDLQRRLSNQREALEDREARTVENEDRIRDETLALSSKRSALSALEKSLSAKESNLKEREADADALLLAAQKEMEVASQASAQAQARLAEIDERSMELEEVSLHIDDRMKAFLEFEDEKERMIKYAEQLEEQDRLIQKEHLVLQERHKDLENATNSLREKEDQFLCCEKDLRAKWESRQGRSNSSSDEDKLEEGLRAKEQSLELEAEKIAALESLLRGKETELADRSAHIRREKEKLVADQKAFYREMESYRQLLRKDKDVLHNQRNNMMLMEEAHAVRKGCLDDANQELLVMLDSIGQLHQQCHTNDPHHYAQRPVCSLCNVIEQKIEFLKRSLLNDAQLTTESSSLHLCKGSDSLKHAKIRLDRVESLVDRMKSGEKSLKERVQSLRAALNNMMGCGQSEASFSFLTSDEEDSDDETDIPEMKIHDAACWYRDLWLVLDDIVFSLKSSDMPSHVT